jgi:L-xylulokinase
MQYTRELVEAVGVPEFYDYLSPFTESYEIMGSVTPEAAKVTGLKAGTPVASGLHDVEACAFGSGAIVPNEMVVIAGTWNINLIMVPSSYNRPGVGGLRRSAVRDVGFVGAIGATSAANLDWFLARCGGDERTEAQAKGVSIYDLINAAVDNLSPDGIDLIYHPFLNLHGQNLPEHARAGFYGLSGWHTKAHMLRALYEGVVFSHRHAIHQLPDLGLEVRLAHLTGGAAKSVVWSQMFADMLALPISVVEAQEVGSLGAAMCAGIGAGVYKDQADAVARAVRVARTHEPNKAVQPIYWKRYDVYTYLIDAMVEPWKRLATLRKA